MAQINPAKFVREVRDEASKVTWPTRKEIGVSTVMVLALVAIAAVFFVLVDMIVGAVVRMLIGI
jgi:preprotein translocase subunit SecE